MRTVNLVRRYLNEELELGGLVLTMFDARTNLAREVAEEVKRRFNDILFETIIPRNIRLSEAPSHGKPIGYYDPSCSGAKAYSSLAEEVIGRWLEKRS
jgi:chromosome partitioning protein